MMTEREKIQLLECLLRKRRELDDMEEKVRPQPSYLSRNILLRLRSEALTVTKEDAPHHFGITGVPGAPYEYVINIFDIQEETVIDHATGLMWCKSTPETPISYAETERSVADLNKDCVAGFQDWRLPTIPELISLLEPLKTARLRLLYDVFGIAKGWYWCWSADTCPATACCPIRVWYVDFNLGGICGVARDNPKNSGFVRAVRSEDAPMISRETYLTAFHATPDAVHHILRCLQCGQKFRVPHREETIKVTCPTCREVCHIKLGERV